MKVVFLVSHLLSGGAERTVAYLSGYFAENGVDTTVLSVSDEVFYSVSAPVKLRTLGISLGYKNPIDRLLKIVKRVVCVRRAIKDIAPDVVFCMLPTMAKYLKKNRKKHTPKIILSERNNPLVVGDNARAKKEKIFAAADGVVFQTERARDCFPENVRKKGVVIPNAVGNPLCYTVKAALEKKKKFSAIGRLTDQKDYETLLKAFAEFLKTHEGYTLEIFGGGDKTRYDALSKDLGIFKNVTFAGVDKNAIEKAANSTAFVMSSKYEGMPNALMEAMAIGLPCVSTDCPFGPRELIDDGVNGLLVPVGDHKALSDALAKVADDKEFAEKISQNARRISETNDLNVISERYLKYVTGVYEQSND